jgi:hypothetical protein
LETTLEAFVDLRDVASTPGGVKGNNMQIWIKATRWVVTVVLLAILPLPFGRLTIVAATPVQSEENSDVARLLADARDKAAILSRDADELEALTRSNVSWEGHAAMLDTIKSDVNDLAHIVEQLNAARSSASPWQQQAIDRMIPLMKELAANTTAAINHLRDNQIRPNSGPYPEYLTENRETAHELSDLISSVVQYGQARAKLEKLEQKLELASK